VPAVGLYAGLKFGGRIGRLHVDQAGERVRAIPRALGAPQHIHLLDVEERRGAAQAGQVDVVDQESNRRIRRALVLLEFADATNLQVSRAIAITRIRQVRHKRDQFLEVLHARVANRRAVEHGDTCRHSLRAGLAKCGHDELVYVDDLCVGGGGLQQQRLHHDDREDHPEERLKNFHVRISVVTRDPVSTLGGESGWQRALFLRRY